MPGKKTLPKASIRGFLTPFGVILDESAKLGVKWADRLADPKSGLATLSMGIEIIANDVTGQTKYNNVHDVMDDWPFLVPWLAPQVKDVDMNDSAGIYLIGGPANSLKSFTAGVVAEEYFTGAKIDYLDARWNEPVEDKKVVMGQFFPLCNSLLDSANMILTYITDKPLMKDGASKYDELVFRTLNVLCHQLNITIIGSFNDSGSNPISDTVMGAVDGFMRIRPSGNSGFRYQPSEAQYRSRKRPVNVSSIKNISGEYFTNLVKFMIVDIKLGKSPRGKYSINDLDHFIKRNNFGEDNKSST